MTTFDSVKIFRWGDIVIGFILLAGIFFSIPLLRSNNPQEVEFFRDNEKIAKYPLFENRELTIQGHLGNLKVKIFNNSVSIINSDCPHHLCIKSGPIRFPNTQIVCAPNHILITIKSSEKKLDLDGIAR